MKLIKLFGAASCITAALLWAGTALAAPYLDWTDDQVQWLEDSDAEILLDSAGDLINILPPGAGGDGTYIQIGDLFAGVFKIQATQLVNPAVTDVNLQGDTETFTAIFLISTTGITCATAGCDTTTIDSTTDTLSFGRRHRLSGTRCMEPVGSWI